MAMVCTLGLLLRPYALQRLYPATGLLPSASRHVHHDVQAKPQSDCCYLALVAHHIVADQNSMEIMLQDLAKIYSRCVDPTAPELEMCPVQYLDYAHWQGQQLETGQLEGPISFHLKHLEHAPLSIDLPNDSQRPAVFSSKGAWVPFELSETEVAALLQLSQHLRVTLLEIVLSAVQVSCAALVSWFSGACFLDKALRSEFAVAFKADIDGRVQRLHLKHQLQAPGRILHCV